MEEVFPSACTLNHGFRRSLLRWKILQNVVEIFMVFNDDSLNEDHVLSKVVSLLLVFFKSYN